MTLAVDVLVAAGGLFMGRWLARKLRKRAAVEVVAAGEPPPAGPPVLTGFPCQLGDVVVRTAERDEAWLAGALVFEEKGPVAVLFVAPEAGSDLALFARSSDPGLTWLSPLAPGDLASTRDPSPTIEHGGVRFERERRLPVRVTELGSGAPRVGDHAVIAEYRGPGAERIVVVAGSDRTVGWVGVALEKREYDVLPGGKTTLE